MKVGKLILPEVLYFSGELNDQRIKLSTSLLCTTSLFRHINAHTSVGLPALITKILDMTVCTMERPFWPVGAACKAATNRVLLSRRPLAEVCIDGISCVSPLPLGRHLECYEETGLENCDMTYTCDVCVLGMFIPAFEIIVQGRYPDTVNPVFPFRYFPHQPSVWGFRQTLPTCVIFQATSFLVVSPNN
jgi:hypothetical protein